MMKFLLYSVPIVRSFALLLKSMCSYCQEIPDLVGKVFVIQGLKVTSTFGEVPNDMKMLAMLGLSDQTVPRFLPHLQMYQKKIVQI